MARQKRTQSESRTLEPSVKECWRRIYAWLDSNAHESDIKKGRSTSKAAIARCEKLFGRQFPADFKASLAIQSQGCIIPGLSDFDCAYSLMNAADIYDSWKIMNDLYDVGEFDDLHHQVKSAKGVVQQWWSANWIPFADNGGGDHFCIDLGPTFPGVRGQVIWFGQASPDRPIIARSFCKFLENLVLNFENGQYRWNEDDYGFTKKRDSIFPAALYR
jgi:cell wall assembly regulator SMI1